MSTNVTENLRLSGLVLFGNSELMVGLSDSQWLRIALSAFPKLEAMGEDEKLDYHIAADYLSLRWLGHSVTLRLSELWSSATSIEAGEDGPK